jgi:hypothetical protein
MKVRLSTSHNIMLIVINASVIAVTTTIETLDIAVAQSTCCLWGWESKALT